MRDLSVTSALEISYVKNRIVLSAAIAAGLLTLGACAPDPIDAGGSDEPSLYASPSAPAGTTAADVNEALAATSWTDSAEGIPVLGYEWPVNYSDFGAYLSADGDGDEIAAGDVISVQYVVVSGNDGSELYSTWTAGGAQSIQLIAEQIDPALLDVLAGAHVGAKVLYGIPDQGDGTGANLMAINVLGVSQVLDKAEGTPVAPVAGLPVVTLGADGSPSVSYEGATKPTTLVAQDLITGEGAAVAEGQSVTVHYTGWVWEGAEPFDSSWARGTSATFTLATGQLIDGWVQGLVGKTVGSQVLLVIPPELGYGADGSGESIPGDSTLVFVVDILAAG